MVLCVAVDEHRNSFWSVWDQGRRNLCTLKGKTNFTILYIRPLGLKLRLKYIYKIKKLPPLSALIYQEP